MRYIEITGVLSAEPWSIGIYGYATDGDSLIFVLTPTNTLKVFQDPDWGTPEQIHADGQIYNIDTFEFIALEEPEGYTLLRTWMATNNRMV